MHRLSFPVATLTIFLTYFSQVISKTDNTLFAVIGKYPGYSANLNPSGKVTINFKDDGGFTLRYNLKGMQFSLSNFMIFNFPWFSRWYSFVMITSSLLNKN